MIQNISEFKLAGTELTWPIGIAPGMTNHPDIQVVAQRFENMLSLGTGEIVLGSWKLGGPSGGNAHVQQSDRSWIHMGGDEYPEVTEGKGHNSKGLPGPGVIIGLEHLPDFIDLGRSKNTEVSLSISPHTQNPLEEIPELLEVGRRALAAGVLRVEFNLSCPNMPERPPFYLDSEGVQNFIWMADVQKNSMLNRYGNPGIYPKFGPMGQSYDEAVLRDRTWSAVKKGIFGGIVTSNTILGQGVEKEDGTNEITVNGGRAGQSGPAFQEVGIEQLDKWLWSRHHNAGGDLISVLGISSGKEVYRRLLHGASLCQLASVVYWPELVGEESAGVVVEKIKSDFIDTVSK